MGNWNISISGLGCHGNNGSPTDADQLAAGFVSQLLAAGQLVEHANFTYGGKQDLLKVSPKSRTTKTVNTSALISE